MTQTATPQRVQGRSVKPGAITLDAEFRDLLPRPNAEDRKRIEDALIRHGCRESRTPLDFTFRAPIGVSQIHASGWRVKPPSSRGRFVHDN